MKKVYINPTTSIVNIETAQMIAVSGFENSLDTTGKNGNNALSRGGDFWDDDDED